MVNLPIKFHEHLQLADVGIQPHNICFANVTMESDKHIVVRETFGDSSRVVIIALDDHSNPQTFPISADSVIMHPTAKIIALKSGKTLQIFNIELKAIVKARRNDELIVFWKWINKKLIALVSDTAVYHWSIEGESPPVKIFDRHHSLAGSQIVNYRADADCEWLCLVGIAAKDNRVVGSMQLYSTERKVSQPIEGHAACFVRFKLDGNTHTSILFCYSVKTEAGGKLYVVEVGEPPIGNQPFVKKTFDASSQHGILYLVTKTGFIHLHDLESGAQIYSNRISTKPVFVTTKYRSTGGLIVINRKGQVLSVSIDNDNLVPFVIQQMQNPDLALRLALRCDLPGAKKLIVHKFNQLFDNGKFHEAAKVAATAPAGILRTPTTLQKFQQCPTNPTGGASPLLQYFGVLLEHGKLNKYETLEICCSVMSIGRMELLIKWLNDQKLEYCEELGDLVRPQDAAMALAIYLRGNVPHKALQCLEGMEQLGKNITNTTRVGFVLDDLLQLRQILKSTKPTLLPRPETSLLRNSKLSTNNMSQPNHSHGAHIAKTVSVPPAPPFSSVPKAPPQAPPPPPPDFVKSEVSVRLPPAPSMLAPPPNNNVPTVSPDRKNFLDEIQRVVKTRLAKAVDEMEPSEIESVDKTTSTKNDDGKQSPSRGMESPADHGSLLELIQKRLDVMFKNSRGNDGDNSNDSDNDNWSD